MRSSDDLGCQAPGLVFSHQQLQNGLLHVKPILGLVVDDGSWAVHHLIGDLQASVSGQTMHDDGRGGDLFEKSVIDLEGLEGALAFLRIRLPPHVHPSARINDRGVPRGLNRICRQGYISGKHAFDSLIRFVTLGAGNGQVETHQDSCIDPGIHHVASVTNQYDLLFPWISETLPNGKKIA